MSILLGPKLRIAQTPVLSQQEFAAALGLERRRCERSGNICLLTLLEFDKIGQADEGWSTHSEAVVASLRPLIRDTDVIGWYERDRVLGAVFTSWSVERREAARDSVNAKIQKALASSLPDEALKQLQISYYFFPELEGDSPLDLRAFYPDRGMPHAAREARLLKRTLDVTTCLALIPFLLPLFLVIALMVKLTSKGPVFFRQTRLGQFGKKFTLLKFRSMYQDNDPSVHQEYVAKLIAGRDVANSDGQKKQVFKIVADPRVTNVGRFLRKSSLDELPQFINVLAGDMSIIGPRPPLPYEFERYEPWHRRRVMEVKPGITGLWQVNGRSRTTFDEMVRLDLQYVNNWSLWLDLEILLRTPAAVFSGDGAY